MKLHLHQDGLVYVRDADDREIYSGTVEEFTRDRGTNLPPLPDGMVACVYDADTKIMTYYDAKANAHPLEGQYVWDIGEQVIADRASICSAKETRLEVAEAARVEAAADIASKALAARMPVTKL